MFLQAGKLLVVNCNGVHEGRSLDGVLGGEPKTIPWACSLREFVEQD